ncbi:MAG TPA: helix-turn-helix domain-containing protein [Metabacillus sp.]|nr:helix-turn-helix domain-containing protein [Metabacillus sp.]
MSVKNLSYICKLIYESFKIPVTYINEQDSVELKYGSYTIQNPFYTSPQDFYQQINFPKELVHFPLVSSTPYNEKYFMIQVLDQNQYNGTIVVGPALPIELTGDRLQALVHDLSNQQNIKELLLQYYESLFRISSLTFIHISMHLYYMLYQKTLDPVEICLNNKLVGEHIPEIEDPHITISLRRENVSFHHDLMYEKRLFQYIKEGRKEEFLKAYKLSPERGEMGVLSKKSQLRNRKNLGITAITLATRAAMEGGLHHEIAYTLSDLYIQELEELTNIKTADTLIEQALSDFAERVRKNKQQKYSKPINMCLNHIFNHLYEDITLLSLANLVDMHPNYLSSLFKKEVGLSISEYIQRTKIEEAKSLLTFTNYSLLKIATMLNFHDQSYFTKIFKKYTGITPRKYKNTSEGTIE